MILRDLGDHGAGELTRARSMADWYLSYVHPRSLSIAECEQALERAVAPVTTTVGELEGNPRDFYSRSVTARGTRGDLSFELTASQGLRGPDEPEPTISSVCVKVSGPYASKLAAWPVISAAFARLGCAESTYASWSAPIIDEADSEGDEATATRVRQETRAALIAQARRCAHVSITAPRCDVEAILAAYEAAERIVSVSFTDCGLTALPAGLGRFPAIESLWLDEDLLDGSALRGFARPLKELGLFGRGLRRIAREDLAGVPALEWLSCVGSGLEDLDLGIAEVCPNLKRIYLEDTPLAKDASRMAALRARWPGVQWRYDEPPGQPPRPARVESPRAPSKAPAAAPAPPQVDPALAPYFEAILAAPDDDAPRLALAELLTARGDPRGEQIRLACELARLEDEAPGFQQLAARCQGMPQFSYFSERRYPFLGKEWRARGFVETIACSALDFIAHGEQLLRDAPIRVVELTPLASLGPTVARCSTLARLRGLHLGALPREDRAAVLASAHLAGLRELETSDWFDTAAAVGALAEDLRGLGALRVLRLDGRLSTAAVPALIDLVVARGLERLDVRFCSLQPRSIIKTLWEALGDERVRPRRLPAVPYEGGVLELGRPGFSVEQVRELVATGKYRGATELRLHRNCIGDEVAALVATSRAFPALETLNLAASGLTDLGVLTLATEAVALDRLEQVHLGEGERDRLGISDEAVEALARSSRLPALRRITRGIEHHVYGGSARDDIEVTRFRRDDGRVVESVLAHSIWP